MFGFSSERVLQTTNSILLGVQTVSSMISGPTGKTGCELLQFFLNPFICVQSQIQLISSAAPPLCFRKQNGKVCPVCPAAL